MQIKVRTTDEQWTTKNAQRDGEFAVVTVPDERVERLTFAGRQMIRFDLQAVADRLPRDWANRHAMLPAYYEVGAGR